MARVRPPAGGRPKPDPAPAPAAEDERQRTGTAGAAADRPVPPDYGGGCVADLAPAICGFDPSNGRPRQRRPGSPRRDRDAAPRAPLIGDAVLAARAVVLVLFDGLGAEQLAAERRSCPTLAEMSQQTITTVAPTTTATALTSISTGAPPGRHGIVGYRIPTPDGNLNVLSWKTPRGDARKRFKPESFQPLASFGSQRPPVVSDRAYAGSGFTRAYLRDARHVGISRPSGLVVETRRLLADGEPFVYAYYDGPDVIAHAHGFGEHYRAELRACDRMIADLLTEMPRGTAVVVTSDHGLVDCTGSMTPVSRSVLEHSAAESGEYRFRWLHAKPGRTAALREAAVDAHGSQAWVLTAEEIVDEGWLGPTVSDSARSRLGDVALVARGTNAFRYGKPGGNNKALPLKGRHGSLTSAEMLVPLLVYTS